jgi:hypothetical protein
MQALAASCEELRARTGKPSLGALENNAFSSKTGSIKGLLGPLQGQQLKINWII